MYSTSVVNLSISKTVSQRWGLCNERGGTNFEQVL